MKVSMDSMSPLLENILADGKQIKLTVTGMSMYPLLRSGMDTVVLAPCKNHKFKKGDIPFYKRANNSYVMHRILKIDKNGDFHIAGDNQLVIEYPVKYDQCFAYVTGIYRKDKYYSTDSFTLKLYSFFWITFFKSRPLMLKTAKRISRIIKLFKKQ